MHLHVKSASKVFRKSVFSVVLVYNPAPGRCVISSVHSLSASYAYGKGRAVLPSTNLVSSLKSEL